MAEIDLFTFINTNSYDFANLLRETGELTKSGKHDIYWKCVLSNRAKKIPKGFECIADNDSKASCPSMRHAIAIHEAIQKATSDYIIISDADIALTYKNWDDEVIKILNEGRSCFGTPNSSNEHGEQDFPNVPFFAFKKEIIQKVDLDFRPMLNERNDVLRVKAVKEKMNGRGIGDMVFFETGCKLSSNFEKAGLKSKCLCMEVVHPESPKIKLPSLNLKQKINSRSIGLHCKRIYHNQLMEFHHNNNLFLTHIGNSTNQEFTSEDVQSWKNRIEYYLKSL